MARPSASTKGEKSATMSPKRLGLPELSWEDVKLGRKIASGSFSTVYEVDGFTENSQDTSEGGSCHTDATASETDHDLVCPRAPRGSFVLKCLRASYPEDSQKKQRVAAECLAQEAKTLASLPRHPNIVRLVAVSSNLPQEPLRGFVVLERVVGTLEGLIKRWKIRSQSSSLAEDNGLFGFFQGRKQKNLALSEAQASRVQQAGVGLAKAMEFLHGHRILYRDLKPANIGFDQEGQVRLLDFGCARIYEENEGRLMTKTVGSARYMAPEVGSSQRRYGFPADVYSFAILLWETVTLCKPFSEIKTIDGLERIVRLKHKRPSVRKIVSRGLRLLLETSWHPNPEMRPTFALIVSQLEIEGASTDFCL